MAEDDLLEFAMAAHTTAVKALMDYLDGSILMLPPSAREPENCELGRWFDGEGARYAMLPAYVRARDIHRQFHAALVDIVRLASERGREGALARLRSGSPFSHLSRNVVAAIDELAQSITQHEAGAGR